MAANKCEKFRVGRELLEHHSWPPALRKPDHDRCYCIKCYSANLSDTLNVADYTYVIPRGWTRFGVSVDESLFNHHQIWTKWLNYYHGTSIESAISCVEHGQLLLPNDVTMHGKKLKIRDGHIPGEVYVFTTPSISYAALECYVHTYPFISPYNSKLYTIKVALQCKQKPDSIIVQPETVGACKKGLQICRFIPNDQLEWKTKHRSSVMIYAVLLEIKCGDYLNDDVPLIHPSSSSSLSSVPPVITVISNESKAKLDISSPVTIVPVSSNVESERGYCEHNHSFTLKRISILVMLAIGVILPMAALITGQVHKGECTIQPWISQWMTVFGAVGFTVFCFLFIIILLAFKCCSDDIQIGGYFSGCILCLLIFFYFTWLIAGSVWVFRVKPNVQYETPNLDTYCHRDLYRFAFGLLITQYVFIGLLPCIVCIVAYVISYDD